ncbi:MAG: hypothetical protein K0R78_676 [Pelosinus sp.]|jgi:hypothetical protein|nr:hypothetical protein [Pelosinus sp.]
MENRRISIVFCGGCNPRIDRGNVALQIQAILVARGYQIGYNSLDGDFVIYMSGCTVNCALKYNLNNQPSVVVAATSVDAVAIDEGELVSEIVMKVRDYFE